MSTVHERGAAPTPRGPQDPDSYADLALLRDDDMDCCDVCATPATRE